MERIFLYCAIVVFVCLSACTKNDSDTLVLPTPKNSVSVDSIIGDPMVNFIITSGDSIINGDDPVNVEGYYKVEPFHLYNSTDATEVGLGASLDWGTLYIRFWNQTDDGRVTFEARQELPDGKNHIAEATDPVQIYIKGHDNSFAAYFNPFTWYDVTKGTLYTSGTLQNDAINHFAFYFVLTSSATGIAVTRKLSGYPEMIATRIDSLHFPAVNFIP